MAGTFEVRLQDSQISLPCDVKQFLKIAVLVTDMVHSVHNQNEIIHALNPSNIIIQSDGMVAKLAEVVEWHDAYLSPERTGKINRTPDRRSDLYSLGVIYYELLTGQLPFSPNNEEAWSFVHVSKMATPLIHHCPHLEGPLANIVMKLLAKSPELRYESCYGLLADLKQCTDDLAQHGRILPFDIGQFDVKSRFRYSSERIDRGEQQLQLEALYGKVVSGNVVRVNIEGNAGTGKSEFVKHFLMSAIRKGSKVIEVQCHRGQQGQYNEPILQAIRQWVEQLCSDDSQTIAAISRHLKSNIGENLALLVSYFPEIKTLLQDLPNRPLLQSTDLQVEFAQLVPVIFRSLHRNQVPLVLFIDDLQHADQGTLEILAQLSGDKSIQGVMLIGAYQTDTQSNEIHIEEAAEMDASSGSQAESIRLENLFYDDVRILVSRIVNEDSPRVRVLTSSVYNRTKGNPALIHSLFKEWQKNKKLYYNELLHRWSWDVEVTNTISDSSEVLSLYEDGLKRISDEASYVIKVAAVLGTRFHSAVLSEVCEVSHDALISLLTSAEKEGIIYYEDDAAEGLSDDRVYLFMHVQIQNMLLESLDEQKVEWHLKIGRVLIRHFSTTAHQVDFLAAVKHLNQGMHTMTLEEKRELAQYNYQASSQSNASRKHSDGKYFSEVGIALLERELQDPISITYPYYVEVAYSEYMLGNTDQVRLHFQYLYDHSSELNREDRIKVALYQVEIFTFTDNAIAVKNGEAVLAEFGWYLSEKKSNLFVLKEIMHTQIALHSKRHKLQLISTNDDAEYLLLGKSILGVSIALLMHDPAQLMILFARFIRYGLRNGSNEYYLCAAACYDLFLQRGIPDIHRLLPNYVAKLLQTTNFTSTVQNYRLSYSIGLSKQLENPSETAMYFNKAMRRAMECGDATMTNLSMISLMKGHYGEVNALIELISFMEDDAKYIVDEKTQEILKLVKQYVEALQNESVREKFIAIPTEEELTEDQGDNYSSICKLEIAYYAGKYREALYWANHGKQKELEQDWLQNRKLRLFQALANAAIYPSASPEERKEIAESIQKLVGKMDKWAGYGGKRSSAHMLIKAESEKIKGNHHNTLTYYEAAIHKAKEEQYRLIEALAGERLYHFFEESGSVTKAAISLMDAYTAYSEWGITAKVNDIKHKYPHLWWYNSQQIEEVAVSEIESLVSSNWNERNEMKYGTNETEDDVLHQIIQWTGKQEDPNHLEQFLQTTIHQVGADRGYILAYKGDEFQIEAQSGRKYQGEETNHYSAYIARYVRVTGKPLKLSYPVESHYVKDPYIARFAPSSIICMPIRKPHGGTIGLLYLENSEIANVFTERSLLLLELVITRMTYLSWLNQPKVDEIVDRYKAYQANVTNNEIKPFNEQLTNREFEVLVALTDGLSNKEITIRLGISEGTVKTHISNIYGKLGVKRRGQAIARAKELDLI